MGILDLKKHVNRNKCSFATKKRMFGVFAIDKILRYRGTRFPGSRTLCHPGYGYGTKIKIFPKVGLLDDLAVVIGLMRSFFSDIDQQQN